MGNRLPPIVGNWYAHRDKGALFQVVALDEDAGTVEIQEFDGGLDELVEFIPNRRFNSAFSTSSAATRVRSSAITPACSMTRAASSSYDGRPSPACTP